MMDREQIIRWAREVGFDVLLPAEHTFGRGGIYTCSDDEISETLEAFAKLVAAHERERFAAECIDLVAFYGGPVDLEAAIRARGNT